MNLLQGGTYTKRTLPCPICNNTHGCRIAANSIFFACLRTSEKETPHGFKFVKNLSDGMGSLFRRDDLFSRAKHTSYLISNIQKPNGSRQPSSADERDNAYKKAAESSLLPEHTNTLLKRGLSKEFISFYHFFSFERGRNVDAGPVPGIHNKALVGENGIFLPAYDEKSRICGAQLYPDKRSADRKYVWVSSSCVGGESPSLNGELPLFVWKGDNTEVLYLCEGALKSAIAACLSGCYFVGTAASALFGPSHLRDIIVEFKPRLVVITPDAGAIINGIKEIDGEEVYKGGSVAANTFSTIRFLNRNGCAVKVAWWGQALKGQANDIDEFLVDGGTMNDFDLISPQDFYELHHPLLQKNLSASLF